MKVYLPQLLDKAGVVLQNAANCLAHDPDLALGKVAAGLGLSPAKAKTLGWVAKELIAIAPDALKDLQDAAKPAEPGAVTGPTTEQSAPVAG